MVNKRGWIGVDFDGTLAKYETWMGWNVFGEPIAPMVDRVRAWLAEDKEVNIVTARVGLPLYVGVVPRINLSKTHACRVTGERFSDAAMATAIQAWCSANVLATWRPSVMCYKDVDMIELWDDRAVQVIANTGRTLAEEHAAVLEAERGRVFGSS